MKTYDETFERVMAERDSYMRRRKEKIKNTAVGGFVLACVAFSVFAIVKAKGNSIPAYEKAEDQIVAETASATDENGDVFYYTIEDDSAYAVTLSRPETAGDSRDDKAEKTTFAEEAAGKAVKNSETGKSSDEDSVRTETENNGKKETVTSPGNTTSKPVMKETVKAPSTTVAVPETVVSMNYTYYINSGKYKNYCPGKVVEKDKVGERIGSVTVTGYWEGFGAVSENKTQKETLSADAYYIKGVSDDVAVCLKFKDKGDALTTNHYYVVINPKADYSPVIEYIIGGSAPVTAQTPANGDYVTETTAAQPSDRTTSTSKAHLSE